MTTATLNPGFSAKRSAIIAGATAALAIAAMGFASSAEARGDVSFSVGVGLPGVAVGVSNAYPVYGGYPQPVYVQPAPVYVQPRPVYVQPAPVYYEPPPVYYRPRPVYVQPAPVYYERPHGWHGRHGGYYRDRDGDGRPDGYRGGYYGPRPAPIYYQR
jgi:PXPV repeat (3 copies)